MGVFLGGGWGVKLGLQARFTSIFLELFSWHNRKKVSSLLESQIGILALHI